MDSENGLMSAITLFATSASFVAFSLVNCGKKKKGEMLSKSEMGSSSDKGPTSTKKKTAAPAPVNKGPPAPADKKAMAGTHDPNYQTLAGVDGNVFQEKGPAGGGGAPPANAPKPGGPGMAATHDPNYQTLAGLGNDVFAKKDGGGGAAPAGGGAAPPKPGGPGMAGTHDPNYQTLAGLGNDVFQK